MQDFLGKTIEIRIIDFLAENKTFSYNQTEISKCLEISRTSVNQKLPVLIFNGIVDVKETHSNVNSYQLANTGIVKKLIGSVFENSFLVSNYDEEENVVISQKKDIVGSISYNDECRYFCDLTTNNDKFLANLDKETNCFQKSEVVYQRDTDKSIAEKSWDNIVMPASASASA